MFGAPLSALRRAAVIGSRRGVASKTIDISKLAITRTQAPKQKPAREGLAFGANTSDHILEVDWTASEGWHAPTIKPYHLLQIDPVASCLQYGMGCFEGLKAYRTSAGGVVLFRPDMNAARLGRSMRRLAMPELDEKGFVDCVSAFVRCEESWVPAGGPAPADGGAYSLYIRPTAIATWPQLGVGGSKAFKVFMVACPVGPYYPEGFKSVRLLAESKYARAWPGGVGDAKVGGNYAPTILPQAEAAAQGCAQVLWLHGDAGHVTEVGTMNVFFAWRAADGATEVVTPPLDGTILPGVTRDSILALMRKWGDVRVSERPFTIHDVTAAAASGRLLEAFGSGTAAVISPIKALLYKGQDIAVPLNPRDPSAGAGPLAQRAYDELLAIQYGRVPGHPWTVPVPRG